MTFQDEKWIEACLNSNAPCILPGPFPVTLVLAICLILALVTLGIYLYHTLTRDRITTKEDFIDAEKRICARIVYLTLREGADLRFLCLNIARDLIRVTAYIKHEVSKCYLAQQRNPTVTEDQLTVMMTVLREAQALQHAAALIELLLLFRPLLPLAHLQTTRTTERFMTRWFNSLEEFRLKLPDCQTNIAG
jgi:hypothetical protein